MIEESKMKDLFGVIAANIAKTDLIESCLMAYRNNGHCIRIVINFDDDYKSVSYSLKNTSPTFKHELDDLNAFLNAHVYG